VKIITPYKLLEMEDEDIKHFVLQEHSEYLCDAYFCRKVHFPTLIKGKFFLVTYNRCLNAPSEIEWRLQLIRAGIKNSKTKAVSTENAVKIKELNKEWFKGMMHKEYIYEHHFLYHNNFHGHMSIATKYKFIDYIFSRENLLNSMTQAIKYVRKNELPEYLIEEIEELAEANLPPKINESVIVASIDDFIQELNKQTL
jgi:hypothetical protein